LRERERDNLLRERGEIERIERERERDKSVVWEFHGCL